MATAKRKHGGGTGVTPEAKKSGNTESNSTFTVEEEEALLTDDLYDADCGDWTDNPDFPVTGEVEEEADNAEAEDITVLGGSSPPPTNPTPSTSAATSYADAATGGAKKNTSKFALYIGKNDDQGGAKTLSEEEFEEVKIKFLEAQLEDADRNPQARVPLIEWVAYIQQYAMFTTDDDYTNMWVRARAPTLTVSDGNNLKAISKAEMDGTVLYTTIDSAYKHLADSAKFTKWLRHWNKELKGNVKVIGSIPLERTAGSTGSAKKIYAIKLKLLADKAFKDYVTGVDCKVNFPMHKLHIKVPGWKPKPTKPTTTQTVKSSVHKGKPKATGHGPVPVTQVLPVPGTKAYLRDILMETNEFLKMNSGQRNKYKRRLAKWGINPSCYKTRQEAVSKKVPLGTIITCPQKAQAVSERQVDQLCEGFKKAGPSRDTSPDAVLETRAVGEDVPRDDAGGGWTTVSRPKSKPKSPKKSNKSNKSPQTDKNLNRIKI